MSRILEVKNLHKSYTQNGKRLHVLKGIDLEVERGQILSIVGPSGAGKSTLLHLIGGLDEPSDGKVLFDDVDLYKIADSERAYIRNKRIGFVFQFYHLLPELSALENVLLPALITKNGSGQDRAKMLLKEVGLDDRVLHRPAELSGGEQQRVAIARALINNPDIVFCDEPTGNLDSKMGEKIYELIKRFNKENRQTFVIMTHDKDLAKIADKMLHIKDGLIQNL